MKPIEIKNRRKALVEAYQNTASRKPSDTLEALSQQIGKAAAVMAVAEAVNASGEWDQRISRRSRSWAAQVASDEAQAKAAQEARYLFYPDAIHPANMELLAAEAMEVEA